MAMSTWLRLARCGASKHLRRFGLVLRGQHITHHSITSIPVNLQSAPSDLLLDVVRLTNVFTYLLTYFNKKTTIFT